MHDCALGREGGPSAPRVEHRYNAGGGGINNILKMNEVQDVNKNSKKVFPRLNEMWILPTPNPLLHTHTHTHTR